MLDRCSSILIFTRLRRATHFFFSKFFFADEFAVMPKTFGLFSEIFYVFT